jgi:hypothetical protein
MRTLGAAIVALLAALMQVTVSPLFPLGGAVADLGLIAVAFLAIAGGGRAAMLGVPLVALFLGFASNHSPALLLVAYVPLLPLAFLLEQSKMRVGPYIRVGAAVLITGAWARVVLATSAFVAGAEFAPGPLIADIVIPGIAFDAAFFSLCYGALRLARRTAPSLGLERRGWAS